MIIIVGRKLICPLFSFLYSPFILYSSNNNLFLPQKIRIVLLNYWSIARSIIEQSLTIADRYRLMLANRKLRYPFRCSFHLLVPSLSRDAPCYITQWPSIKAKRIRAGFHNHGFSRSKLLLPGWYYNPPLLGEQWSGRICRAPYKLDSNPRVIGARNSLSASYLE